MPTKTPNEAILSALASKGYEVPPGFSPSDKSHVHANVQRAFSANLTKDGNLKASFTGRELWMYEPRLGGVAGKKRPYLFLGHADGGNYTVFTWDFEKPNPAIYVCDSTDEWDADNEEPARGTKLAPSLAAFLKKLGPELPPPKQTKSKSKKSKKSKSKDAPAFADPLVVAEGVSLLACGDHCVLFKENEELVLAEYVDDATHLHRLGPSPISSGLFAVDAKNIVCASAQDDAKVELHFYRRGSDSWGDVQSLVVEGPANGVIGGFAVGGDFMAFGWPGKAPRKEGDVSLPGVFKVLRFDGAWMSDAHFEEDASVETWFGAHVAFDATGDKTRMALASWNAPHVYEREGEAWKPVPLEYPRESDNTISSIDIHGDLVVIGCERARNHVDEFGWVTGHERTGSGGVFVVERSGDTFGKPKLLKGSSKQQSGGVDFEKLGSKVIAGDGWLIASAWQQKAGRPTFTAFARAAGGEWTQRLSEQEGCENDAGRGYSHNLVAHVQPKVKHASSGALTLRRVLPGMAEVDAPTLPYPEPVRVAVEGATVSKELLQMGTGVVVVGDGRYATMCGSKLALFDDEEAQLVDVLEKPSHPAPKLIQCGADVLVHHKSTLWALQQQELKEVEHPLEDNTLVFGGSWGMLTLTGTSASLFDVDRTLLATGTVPANLHWVAGAGDRIVVSDKACRQVQVFDRALELKAELQPNKATKLFGSGLAFDGTSIVVGSASGIHVFEPAGEGYEETALIKLTRSKGPADLFVEVSGDRMAVSCQPMNKSFGAVVILARDPKKKWKKHLQISDCPRLCSVRLTQTRLIVGRPRRTAPIQIHTLES